MSKTVKVPLPKAGIDLVSDETRLVKNTVRTALNVDIGRDGEFGLREGFTQVAAGSGFHSLYHAAQRQLTLVAQNSTLRTLNTSTYALADVTTLKSPHPVTYTEYNGNLYWSNKTTNGWMAAGETTPRPIGIAAIDPVPELEAADGILLPGTYGVLITLVDDHGEEGAATPVETISLPSGGGIRLTGIPTPGGSWKVRVYITAADGEIPRAASEFPAVFSTYVVTERPDGAECDTMNLKPMPAGNFVLWHNGRLVVGNGATLVFSRPMRPHLHHPAYDLVPFSGYISFVLSVGTGLFVGDSRGVWYLGGEDPEKAQLVRVSPHRAVSRSGVMVPPDAFTPEKVPATGPVAVWLSAVGYVAGLPGGQVVELQSDRIVAPYAMIGRTIYLLRDGRKQLITPVNSTSTAVLGSAVDSVIQ